MRQNKCRLTVFFEDPFWVGVLEREQDGKLQVCKITFGAEPKDAQVHRFLLDHWPMLRFSPAVDTAGQRPVHKNPKRVRREIARQVADRGVGTKSQQALQLQREQGKAARKTRSRAQREEEKQRRFEQRRQKKREKKKGH